MEIKMAFRYIIVDGYDNQVFGTDDEALAKEYAECDDNFVIDTENGKVFQYDGTEIEIKAAEKLLGDEDAIEASDD